MYSTLLVQDCLESETSQRTVTFGDVLNAERRIRPYLPPSPLRRYRELDDEVGNDIHVFVKHENHNPTNSFKVRNGLSVMTAMTDKERRRGVVAATRGNHGQGVAYAGRLLGVPVTICVPHGNNPEKNAAMRGFGAEVVEAGRDYDESIEVAERMVHEQGKTLVHSTNNRQVLAGAGTLSLEVLRDQARDLDAMVLAVGGGSIAVGALTAARALHPKLEVFGVQAEGASAMYRSWKAGHPVGNGTAATFADGLATRGIYEMTFGALREGLTDFVTVTESEIAEALRMLIRTTHNLAEGAGAAGLAGLLKLRDRLAGKRVGIVLSGSNIDRETLNRVLNREL